MSWLNVFSNLKNNLYLGITKVYDNETSAAMGEHWLVNIFSRVVCLEYGRSNESK
jgi:hypothetical protein